MAQKKIFTALNLQENLIKNVGAPVDNNDVATKASAQAQADTAKSEAISEAATDAATKANAAQAAAEATAASLASAAQTAAISAAAADAETKASAALTSANTYTDGKITALVNGAPDLLNTLDELAAALGDDANFATTVTNAIAAKTSKAAVTITGAGTSTSEGFEYSVAHNLDKATIVAQVFDGSDVVDVFIRKVDNNTLKVITGAALGSTQLSVVVVG
jgi:membrane protein involved in colicin uptake